MKLWNSPGEISKNQYWYLGLQKQEKSLGGKYKEKIPTQSYVSIYYDKPTLRGPPPWLERGWQYLTIGVGLPCKGSL